MSEHICSKEAEFSEIKRSFGKYVRYTIFTSVIGILIIGIGWSLMTVMAISERVDSSNLLSASEIDAIIKDNNEKFNQINERMSKIETNVEWIKNYKFDFKTTVIRE